MQTRVRPRDRKYSWEVEILDPYTDQWIKISTHHFFWAANWKARRLSKKSLTIKTNKKKEFLDKLKGIHKNKSSRAIGCPP